MEHWPEGPAAAPEKARERYNSDLRQSRRALRAPVRADLPAARLDLGVVIVAAVIVGVCAGPARGALAVGAFAALFLVVQAVVLVRGTRGVDAGRRAHLFASGWANRLRCTSGLAVAGTTAGPVEA